MRSHCFLVFVVVLFTISCLGQQSLPLYSVSFTDHQGAQPTHLENSGPPGVAYWQQFAKLASPGKTNFKFAQSVAIDGATIVVGIPHAGHGMGKVLVVEKNGQSSTVA